MSETVNNDPELDLTDLNPETPYDVYVRAICGQSDNSDLVGPLTFTTAALGINDATIEGFVLYPNPVQDQLTMSAASTIENVTIYNTIGQVVLQLFIGKTNTKIDVSTLASGIYLMQVTSNMESQTVKFIKK